MACSSVPEGKTTHKQMKVNDKQCTLHAIKQAFIDYFQHTESFAGFADGLDVSNDIKVLIGHDCGLKEEKRVDLWMKCKAKKRRSAPFTLIIVSVNGVQTDS